MEKYLENKGLSQVIEDEVCINISQHIFKRRIFLKQGVAQFNIPSLFAYNECENKCFFFSLYLNFKRAQEQISAHRLSHFFSLVSVRKIRKLAVGSQKK
jgi:hypothetical protein